MGFFKSMRDLHKEAIDIEKTMPPVKDRMKGAPFNLGIIASVFVYDTVLKNDPTGFTLVKIRVKESRLNAWIRLR